jgi:hypothetical protein
MDYQEVKLFLNTLEYPYYVYGGKALSHIIRDVYSKDWDIVIGADPGYIQTMKEVLEKVIGNQVGIDKKSFTLENTGYSSNIYTLFSGKQELVDVSFTTLPLMVNLVELDGIYYLDLPGIYNNLRESVHNSTYILDSYYDILKISVEDQIGLEIDQQMELLEDYVGDSDAESEINEEINNINSQEHKDEIYYKVREMLDRAIPERDKILKLITKNSDRMFVILEALQKPAKFRSEYIINMCNDCHRTNSVIAKEIGKYKTKCVDLCDLRSLPW